MRKIAIACLCMVLVFTQCRKTEEILIEPQDLIEDEISKTENVIISEEEAFEDPTFLTILSEIGDLENEELILKSSELNEEKKIKLDYKKIIKIKKGTYESFTFLVDENDRSKKFSNLILETNGIKTKAILLAYIPKQEVIKNRKLGYKTKFEGQIHVTEFETSKLKLKSYSCLYITVYEEGDCPNPACDGGAGCLWECDGGSSSTTYTYCYYDDGGSSSTPANPTSPPDGGYAPGEGSYTNTVDPYYPSLTNEEEARIQIKYLKTRGGRDLAEVFEGLLSDKSIPMSDVSVIYSAIEKAYLELKALYMMAVFSPENIATILSFYFSNNITKATRVKAFNLCRQKQISVFGHYPEYLNLADDFNANRFSIPSSTWNAITEAERWAANVSFMDDVIARNDMIVLATPTNMARPGSCFFRELQYFISKGYKISSNKLYLYK